MVKLAILWHMHQPYYEDLATGEHILPWVRLHAIKDYYGMVALLEEFPGVHVTFNLVPSLLVQVQAFAEDRANDRHLAIGLKPADTLEPGERAFLVANGFHAPVDRMIRRFPRYAALYQRRLAPESFTSDDLRDLQVWHKLAWMDPDWLQRDPRLIALIGTGSGFTEDDKAALRSVELDLLNRVIPAYRAAAERGQVELSTSPFYHPILPLLCDSDAHLTAHPHSTLPRGLFRWPSDAREQLARAVRLHTALFGTPPRGVWPSEGSVSDEAARLIAETGCTWTATDEGILARSLSQQPLSADSLYRVYETGDGSRPLRCLFRDHGLSDLVGFSYQSWAAAEAADDFVRRVMDAGRRFAGSGGGEDATVTVILDGENAWEHYPGGGRPFLRALYSRLEQASDIRTVSMSEAAAGPPRRLPSLFPGSWINSDLYTWAGHADDHRAWSHLAGARRVFEECSPESVSPADRLHAYEELLIAEGSDWFWWYGDDHTSDHDSEFDDLFRRHVGNVYRALGAPVPDSLLVPISSTAPAGPLQPRGFIDPVLDGEVTGFGEWAGAVRVALDVGGAMHRVSSELVLGLYVGVGRAAVFLRLDGPALARGLSAGQYRLSAIVDTTTPHRIDLSPAAGTITEVALAFARFDARPAGRVSVSILVTDAQGQVIEQHPAGPPIEIQLPSEDLDAIHWVV